MLCDLVTHRPYLVSSLQAFETECALRMSRLPTEPEANDPEAIHVMLRMPDGERMERRFLPSDKLEVCAPMTELISHMQCYAHSEPCILLLYYNRDS